VPPVLALLLGAMVAARPALAQDDVHVGALPEKNEHVFVPTAFIPDAFIDTQLAITLGYSNTIETEIPLLGPGGQQIAIVKGDLLFVVGGFEFNCALRDWIGFYARFNALARSGGNTASIFATGLSAGSAFLVGWEFGVAETEKSVLSASVEVGQTAITVIDVGGFIEDPSLGLSRSYTPLMVNAAARYAYGINDLVGLSATGSIGHGETPGNDLEDTWFWRLGGVASFNFSRRYDVPLGVALGLRTSSYPLTFENVDGNSWAGLFSIAYMGRPDFGLTLDTEYERVPISYQDVTMGYVGVTIGLRYYF
jgi:hypothetical protein